MGDFNQAEEQQESRTEGVEGDVRKALHGVEMPGSQWRKRSEGLARSSGWVDIQKLTARTAQGSEPSDWHKGPTLPLPFSDHQRKASKSGQ